MEWSQDICIHDSHWSHASHDDPDTRLFENGSYIQTHDNTPTPDPDTNAISKFNFREVYAEHQSILRTWHLGEMRFSYDMHGCLMGPYSAREINAFIHARESSGNDSTLQILIQRCPQSKERFMKGQPNCLFEDCPIGRLTQEFGDDYQIGAGEYMVAFDELIDYRMPGRPFNPYAVSGYAHLYCVERWLDLPTLCMIADLNVQPAEKYCATEPGGQNPLALDDAAHEVVQKWLEEIRDTFRRPVDYPPRDYTAEGIFPLAAFEGSLAHSMHLARVAAESRWPLHGPAGVQLGTHVDVHLGNLEVYLTVRLMQMYGEGRIGYRRRESLQQALEEFAARQQE